MLPSLSKVYKMESSFLKNKNLIKEGLRCIAPRKLNQTIHNTGCNEIVVNIKKGWS